MSASDPHEAEPPRGGLVARADAAARAREARLAGVADELHRPAPLRLDDATRSAVARMLDRLVDGIEQDLRARLMRLLGADAPAELAIPRIAIARPLLATACLPDDGALLATLLRRHEEHRLIHALRRGAAAPGGGERGGDALLDHPDADVAAAAHALLLAEAGRYDDFLDPLVTRGELPAETHHALAWGVAAGLRHYLVATHGLGALAVDHAIAQAVGHALAGLDEEQAPAALAMRLARALARAGALDDVAIVDMLAAGHPLIFVASLATRVGIAFADAWDMAVDGGGDRLGVLLRAAGVARDEAVASLALLRAADGRDAAAAGAAIQSLAAGYALLDAGTADEAVRRWRLEPCYRRAIEALDRSDRKVAA